MSISERSFASAEDRENAENSFYWSFEVFEDVIF
jgi:hypothetical protein